MANNHSDDLDELLDSALDDFQTLNLASNAQRGVDVSTEEIVVDKQVITSTSKSAGGSVHGLGMGLPDLKSKKKGKQKVPGPSNQDSHFLALDKLREQTKEAVKGLESVTTPQGQMGVDNFGNDAMMEDWVKQFEELAGGQDVGSLVETMMQQLLSKDILHEPMKEIGERYPAWLEANKPKVSDEEFARYSSQYGYIKELNRVYETEPDNFTKIVELMQKMQECGQPPNDIVQELAPDFDISSLGQLSPEMLENQENCSIM